jgi:hypothetical protein
MAERNNRTLKVAAAIAASFTALAAGVIVLMVRRIVSFQMALLMLVALLALYFGFGVLIAVYRFVGKLE